ncbi:MAG: hypothetical protein QOG15_23 [Solirubrobacteraceae bacterium]|nr:hypothetical protein [Solirubrobacteraceae bacterium]
MRFRGEHRRRLVVALMASVAVVGLPSAAQANVAISDAAVTEGNGPAAMTFYVVRTAGLAGALGASTISYATANGSALSPGDYTAAQGTVTFPAAGLQPSQTLPVNVAIAGDTVPEGTETFSISITGASGGDPISRGTGTGTIADNDAATAQGAPGRSTSTLNLNQQLIARTPGGGLPNAGVFEPTISGDSRIGRYVAYSSAATNIAGPTDGHRNIFLVKRGGSAGSLGTPWVYGSTILASAGRGGAAANGNSASPSLGGWTQGDSAKTPTCLGFVSQASNLVAGDSNGHADGFVRKLSSGKVRRIKTPAAASEIAVSGDCKATAIVAGGSLYVKRGTKKQHKLVSGGVSSADLTFNGSQVAYDQNGAVRVRSTKGGAARGVASGGNPSADAGRPKGKVRRVAYQRGSSTFIAAVGGGEKLMSPGTLPAMSAGGTAAMFAFGPYAYLYAVSNGFGKAAPQGACPAGQGSINGLALSARGNYAVFSCSGGPAYLSFLGGR